MAESENPLKIEKWRVAEILKISDRTLCRWLNVLYYDDLKKQGYRKTQHGLLQHQLDVVFPYGLDFEFNPEN